MSAIKLYSSDNSLLISNAGCEYDVKLNPLNLGGVSGLNLSNQGSIKFTGDGFITSLMGHLKISERPGNQAVLMPDGLFVDFNTYAETPITTQNTDTINLLSSGSANHTLRAELKISSDAGNLITKRANGIYVSAPTGGDTYTDARARVAISANVPLTYNAATGIMGINQSSATHSGYLSSLDWIRFNSKEPAIASGAGTQYWAGTKTWRTLDTVAVLEVGPNYYFTPTRFDQQLATKTTDDLEEGSGQLYFTIARSRNAITGLAPITYNSATGVVGIDRATSTINGYLGFSDFVSFDSRVLNATSVGTGVGIFKQKNSSKELELYNIKGGTGVSVSLVSNDIVISANAGAAPPVANAGPDQNIVSPATTAVMAGGGTGPNPIAKYEWSKISGPSTYNITDAGAVNTTITGLTITGVYKFRLTVIDTIGLVASDEIIVNVSATPETLDTVYYGAKASGTAPTLIEVTGGTTMLVNASTDAPINWTSLTSTPKFCWFAIPNLGVAYNKNKWYVDAVNNGDIGTGSDLFNAPTTVTIGGQAYYVWITNYATQFVASCLLKKV